MADSDLFAVKLGDFLGKSSEGFLTKLTEAKLDTATSKYLIGQYFQEQAGTALRSFSYSAGSRVAAANPACKADFAPSFSHRAWQDGEDLVEAEGINGFNVRFNALRADLEAVQRDLRQAFECLAGLQKSVAGALGEVTTELNAISRQVHDCCDKAQQAGPVLKDLPGRSVYVNDPYGSYYPVPLGIDPRVVNPALPGLAVNPAAPTVWRDAANANKGLIQGMAADRIDKVNFNGKPMDVWKTNLGLVLTEAEAAGAGAAPSFVPDKLNQAREFNRFVTDSEVEVTTAFPGGFTKREFEEKFGATTLAGQSAVRDVIKELPDDMRFDSVAKLSDAVAEVNAKSLDAAGLAQATIVGAVGLNAGIAASDVPIGSIKFADEATRTALDAAGVKTVGDLATVDVGALKTKLDAAGVNRTVGELAGLRGIGKSVTQLGTRFNR